MNNDFEQLKLSMLQLLQSRPDLAKYIGETSRSIAAAAIEEDDEDGKLDRTKADDYAIFFCIGAAWAITSKITDKITEV